MPKRRETRAQVHITNKKIMDTLLTKIPAWAAGQETAEARLAAAFWLSNVTNGTKTVHGLRNKITDIKAAAVRDLSSLGMSDYEIAEIVGVHATRIRQLRDLDIEGWPD